MSDKKEIEIELGDNGAGTHCDDQFMRYAGGGAVAGNDSWCAIIRSYLHSKRCRCLFRSRGSVSREPRPWPNYSTHFQGLQNHGNALCASRSVRIL